MDAGKELQLAQQGDTNAFTRLVEAHQDMVYRLALRFTMHPEHAADVTQETFIRVWKHLPRFKTGMRFTTWLYRITVNLCYDHLRAQQSRNRVFERDPFGIESVMSRHNPETELAVQEKLAAVQKAAASLPAKQRMVFVLRDLEDRDFKEIAGLLGMSQGSVRSLLHVARKAIRQKCNQDQV